MRASDQHRAAIDKVVQLAMATDHPLTATEKATLLAIFAAPAGRPSDALAGPDVAATEAIRARAG
jgi:hypothetical protein